MFVCFFFFFSFNLFMFCPVSSELVLVDRLALTDMVYVCDVENRRCALALEDKCLAGDVCAVCSVRRRKPSPKTAGFSFQINLNTSVYLLKRITTWCLIILQIYFEWFAIKINDNGKLKAVGDFHWQKVFLFCFVLLWRRGFCSFFHFIFDSEWMELQCALFFFCSMATLAHRQNVFFFEFCCQLMFLTF